jgi:hypothetical protein
MDITVLHKRLQAVEWSAWTASKSPTISTPAGLEELATSHYGKLDKRVKMRLLLSLLNVERPNGDDRLDAAMVGLLQKALSEQHESKEKWVSLVASLVESRLFAAPSSSSQRHGVGGQSHATLRSLVDNVADAVVEQIRDNNNGNDSSATSTGAEQFVPGELKYFPQQRQHEQHKESKPFTYVGEPPNFISRISREES